jgi:hypothetical protein
VNSTPQSVDTDSLAVVDLVKECFQTLSLEVGPIGNIYMVFMHDLAVHFSGILMHRVALKRYPDETRFPWVNKNYAHSPHAIELTEDGRLDLSNGLKTYLRQLSLSQVALGEALPFGYHQDRFQAKVINLLGSYKPFVQAYLPQREDQIGALLDCVEELCRLHEIVNAEVVRQNWLQYAELHTSGKQTALRERSVLLGTRNNTQNRKLAVNYLQQGKEVVAITHGEVANSVMDEPPFGYSERTLCTTLIDYGDFDADGQYNAPIFQPRQRFYRSAPVARSIHRPSDNIRPPIRQSCRALYIPTTYTGNGLYGPFHIYEDSLYKHWQQVLFKNFPGLTLKAHPKSRSESPASLTVERRRLEDCMNDYDLIVFDYFGTGSMLALVSDKPVIYFDIGLRRLHPKFVRELKSRCEHAKIDLNSDISGQVKATLARFWSGGVSQTNTGIAPYALCKESQFSWFGLFKSVARGAPPPWQ